MHHKEVQRKAQLIARGLCASPTLRQITYNNALAAGRVSRNPEGYTAESYAERYEPISEGLTTTRAALRRLWKLGVLARSAHKPYIYTSQPLAPDYVKAAIHNPDIFAKLRTPSNILLFRALGPKWASIADIATAAGIDEKTARKRLAKLHSLYVVKLRIDGGKYFYRWSN